MTCTGVILAGGAATRYGGHPKGLERVGGVRLIDRVARALATRCDSLLLVANADDATSWLPGTRVVRDVRPGEGALGGLLTALVAAGGDAIVVAWDMPFVEPALLAALRARGEQGDVDAVLPESDGSPRGTEPMCAWYSARCVPAIIAALDAGDRRAVAFHDSVRVARLPLAEVQRFGEPARMFANVNAPADLPRTPPMLAVVGKKHAGKTTLVTQLSAALTRRGLRIMTLKHSSHTFALDPEATDTYRHFHEGNAERVAMVSPDTFAMVQRWSRERSPEELAAEYLADADVVLCEGYKSSQLPKLEVARAAVHTSPLWAPTLANAATWEALVTDLPVSEFPGRRFALDTPDLTQVLADWVVQRFVSSSRSS